jgi:Cdc6-like AAA superfamily ATPase
MLANAHIFHNKHYQIPHNISSMFTGREDICKQLNESCLAPRVQDILRIQRRFILYGLGGSGKTQVSLKFAQDHREK